MSSYHGWTHAPKARGGTDPIPGGRGIFEIKVFDDLTTVLAGDAAFTFEIPEDLDGALLVKTEAYVTTVSSSGVVQVQLHKLTAAVDMLSTKISIDVGEKNSKDAGTQPVVNLANDDVAWGDHIRIDVDAAGTGAKGLGVILYFVPVAVASLVLEGIVGPQGATGGITDWTGQWVTATAYAVNEAVSYNGSSYVASSAHTSGASTEPGVGASWETVWMELASGVGDTTPADGWVDDSAATWTYASATTFTVTGDRTAIFSKGTRIKLTQTTAKYFVVVGSSHAAGTTTVTISGGTDYTLTNAAISANYYSYTSNPQGYPDWFAYTPTWTGASTNPTIGNGSIVGSFQVSGRLAHIRVLIVMGSTTTYGTGIWTVSYPVTEIFTYGTADGLGLAFDASSSNNYHAIWRGGLIATPASPAVFYSLTVPFTWATDDQLQLNNALMI